MRKAIRGVLAVVVGVGLLTTVGCTVGGIAGPGTTTAPPCIDDEPWPKGDFTPGAAPMIELTIESPWDNWISLPQVVVYADGSVVSNVEWRPQSAIGGEGIPPVLATTTQSAPPSHGQGEPPPSGLTPPAVGYIGRCRLASLLAELVAVDPPLGGFGESRVMDANCTSILVHPVGGATGLTYSAYALGIEDSELAPAEVAARKRLQVVIDRIEGSITQVGRLPISRIELTRISPTSGRSEGLAGWPLSTTPEQLLAGKRCTEVKDADAVKIAGAVPAAGQGKSTFLYAGPWSVADRTESYLVRVLPPGVRGCR